MKVTLSESAGAIDLVVEGQLTGMSAQKLVRAWGDGRRSAEGRRLRVDLSRLTHVGAMGRELLEAMHRCGCELMSTNPDNALAEEILESVGP